GRFPEALIRQARGWPDDEWDADAEALRSRGLLTPGPSPALTDAGRAVLGAIEAHTDDRAWTGGLAMPGEQGAAEVIALLRPSVDAVIASGMLPQINPAGLSLPS